MLISCVTLHVPVLNSYNSEPVQRREEEQCLSHSGGSLGAVKLNLF